MSPGWTLERAVEPLFMLAIVVVIVIATLMLLGVRLSRRSWIIAGIVALLMAPAAVVAYHEIFTNIDYLPA